MYQGLQYDLAATLTAVEEAGLFVSTCTINRRANPPTVSSRGQVQMGLADYNIVVLTDIPCMKAVWRMKPDISAVKRSEERFDTLTERHTLLDGWFPQILQRDIATITDYDQTTGAVSLVTVYEIMAMEPSSQGIMTRLALRTFVI